MTNPRRNQRIAKKRGAQSRSKSVTFIIPVKSLDAINACLERQGFGPNNFSVEMESGLILKRVSHVACSVHADPSIQRAFENIITKHTGAKPKKHASISDAEKSAKVKRKTIR